MELVIKKFSRDGESLGPAPGAAIGAVDHQQLHAGR
jgi:hypothetical protein